MRRKTLPYLDGRFRPPEEGEPSEYRARLLRTLRRLIGEQLSEAQRQVVELYYGGGLTVRAIAARRGVAPSTVSRTLRHAEGRLRDYLQYL